MRASFEKAWPITDVYSKNCLIRREHCCRRGFKGAVGDGATPELMLNFSKLDNTNMTCVPEASLKTTLGQRWSTQLMTCTFEKEKL